MKKLMILSCMLILCSAVVFAETDSMRVYSFKVFVAGKSLNTVWDDDSFTVAPGNTVEAQMRFEHDYNYTVTVHVKGILYDIGGDITRTKDVEVAQGSRVSTVLEYFVPADQREANYDLQIEYKYTINSTEFTHKKTFTMEVAKEAITTNMILVNLTAEIAKERGITKDLVSGLSNISGISTTLSDCQYKLGKYDTATSIDSEYKSKYETENSKSNDLQVRLTQCNSDKTSMFTLAQMNEQKNNLEAFTKARENERNLLFFAGIIVAVVMFMKKKKGMVGNLNEVKPLTGDFKKPWLRF